MNLLQETTECIARSGHTPEDAIFIGSTESGHGCTWDEFRSLADFDYDPGFGAAEVPTDLRIVFSDGSDMRRGEYDGQEWWEYSKPFVRPSEPKAIHTLEGGAWSSVGELQEP
jgi:hypothetical protein